MVIKTKTCIKQNFSKIHFQNFHKTLQKSKRGIDPFTKLLIIVNGQTLFCGSFTSYM